LTSSARIRILGEDPTDGIVINLPEKLSVSEKCKIKVRFSKTENQECPRCGGFFIEPKPKDPFMSLDSSNSDICSSCSDCENVFDNEDEFEFYFSRTKIFFQIKKMFARALFRPAIRQIVASQSSLVRPSVRALSRSDSEFLSWVEDQLEHEKPRNVSDLSGGWSKPKADGAIGVINKEKDGEKITVRFNFNGSMPTLEEQDLMEEKGEEPLW
jgi:hypothetical protein